MDTQANDTNNQISDARNEILNSLHNLDATNPVTEYFIHNMEAYINTIDEPVTTEELLEDDEIINLIQADSMMENDDVQPNSDEENEAPPPPSVSVTEAYDALKTLITYCEQHAPETELNNDEIKMLRKKVSIFEVMTIQAKKQTNLDAWQINRVERQFTESKGNTGSAATQRSSVAGMGTGMEQ